MWYEQIRPKRILPVRFVDHHHEWESWRTPKDILKQEYQLQVVEDPHLAICSQFGGEHTDYRCPKILYTGESRGYNPDDYDLLVNFDYQETEKSFRFPYYGFYFPGTTLCKNISKDNARNILRRKTRFCNFVYSNDWAQERIAFTKLLSEYKEIDCCGAVLNNTGFHVPGRHSGPEKIAFLAGYKFTIAFENTVQVGYTTEKICNPMVACSLPIYYGNPEIGRDFNTKSFINVHEFSSFEQAVEKIIEIDRDDELYIETMTEFWFTNNRPTSYVDTGLLLSRLSQWIEERHLSIESYKFY